MAALSQLWAAPLLAPVLAPSPRRAAATATCPGDCDADGAVGIAELVADGSPRAELPQSECLVCSSGRFLYLAPYATAAGGSPPPLRMWGGIAAGDGPAGRGAFAIGDFPEVAETGVWQAERLDRPGRRR